MYGLETVGILHQCMCVSQDWNTGMEFLEWDSYLCTPLIGLDEVLVVELSPCEDITPVAEVIRAVGETISE